MELNPDYLQQKTISIDIESLHADLHLAWTRIPYGTPECSAITRALCAVEIAMGLDFVNESKERLACQTR